MNITSEHIIYLRSTLKLTQEYFAKSLDYSRSYVNDIESGRVKPSRGFLEAIKSTYGLSIDALLSNLGIQIIDGINVLSITPSNKGFIYLYDFTDRGIDKAENKLLEFLAEKKFKIVSGQQIKGELEFFSTLSGLKEKPPRYKHFEYFLKTWNKETNDYFIVLKRFSESPIRNRMPYIYRDMAQYMTGTLIVIDKPSYLEKHSDLLYYFALPIHFKDFLGFMHKPS